MIITDFTENHIERAIDIAKRNYQAERERVPALPPVADWPDMTCFAQNRLGVTAFEDGEMLGFLCGLDPWDGAWNNPGLRHIFSPMHGNGTTPENRAEIYARLYQAAGAKWAEAGAASHGVCLYAHDAAGQAQFFRYGFGMRCVDAVRTMEPVEAPICEGVAFSELLPEEFLEALPLDNALHRHFSESPFFMSKPPHTGASFLKAVEGARFFAARKDGKAVAFLCAEVTGETFIRDLPGYIHVDGAYCLPEHRGGGVSQKLLGLLVETLKADGYTSLGVDFESFNPSGSAFWLKHFTAYTHSVVRRADEAAVRRP